MADFDNGSVEFLTGADFQDDYPKHLKDPRCTIVLFYADWCPHCVNFKPVYAKFADTAQFLRVAAVDTVANETLSKRVGIKSFPTLIKYSKGEPVGEIKDREYGKLIETAMDLCNSGCRCHGV